MNDWETRMVELAASGLGCSQILMELLLEMEGKENPDLIRALGGLKGGMARCGYCCGALTGGAAALGYYTSNGFEGEMPHEKSQEIITEYVNWFADTYGKEHGGTDCRDIIQGDFEHCVQLCAPMVQECFQKLLELLTVYELLE